MKVGSISLFPDVNVKVKLLIFLSVLCILVPNVCDLVSVHSYSRVFLPSVYFTRDTNGVVYQTSVKGLTSRPSFLVALGPSGFLKSSVYNLKSFQFLRSYTCTFYILYYLNVSVSFSKSLNVSPRGLSNSLMTRHVCTFR